MNDEAASSTSATVAPTPGTTTTTAPLDSWWGLSEVLTTMATELKALRAEVRALRQTKAEPKQLLSQRQAAKALGICRDTLRLVVNAKKVKTTRVNGRLRIPRTEIERLTAEGINTESY